jgi:acyl-CoA hydrolase
LPRDKRGLGIHTEMFTHSVTDLVEAETITGAAKERNRGKVEP